MFTFMHLCEILCEIHLVVRHDICFVVISLCHVVGYFYLAFAFLLRCTMSHMLLYPVVHISYFWMQDGRLG